MGLEDLIREIPHFNGWSHPQKIRLLGWHLHSQRSMDRFSGRDILACYTELAMDKPVNVSQSLADLAHRRDLLRDARGWHLERKVREQLDAKYGQRGATVEVHKLLQALPATLADTAERAYLDEALICFKHRAYRAAIVMCWNLAYDHLCQHILKHKLAEFNAAVPAKYSKKKFDPVTRHEDFADWKESEVVEIANTADIIGKNVYQVLNEKLKKRNLAAHPSGLTFGQLQAEEYISDLIQNAVLKIKV